MFIKTREAAKLLGVNESTFRVWVRKKLVPVRRIGTSHALFDPKKLLEWWRSVENVPDTEELNVGQKVKTVHQINGKKQAMELAQWRKKRSEGELEEMEQVING